MSILRGIETRAAAHDHVGWPGAIWSQIARQADLARCPGIAWLLVSPVELVDAAAAHRGGLILQLLRCRTGNEMTSLSLVAHPRDART